MADQLANTKTTLSGEEAIVRAVQFFSTERWRTSSQSARVATFEGRGSIPVFMILLTMLGFFLAIVPGLILYFFVVRRMRRFQNLVVTVTPVSGGSDVSVKYPPVAKRLVKRYLAALPQTAAVTT